MDMCFLSRTIKFRIYVCFTSVMEFRSIIYFILGVYIKCINVSLGLNHMKFFLAKNIFRFKNRAIKNEQFLVMYISPFCDVREAINFFFLFLLFGVKL